MTPYWIRFSTRSPVCVEAASKEEAMSIAARETQVAPTGAEELPYPASPRVGVKSDCPSFCYSPRECAGRTCCPKNYSCSE